MNLIKERLYHLGLSQSKAARLADIPQPSFNQIANGKFYPCPSWRHRIAEVLQAPESELFSIYIERKEV
jgi:predicted transcriptional regulator